MNNYLEITVEETKSITIKNNGRLRDLNDRYVKHWCIDCDKECISPLSYLRTNVGRRCNWCAYNDEY